MANYSFTFHLATQMLVINYIISFSSTAYERMLD